MQKPIPAGARTMSERLQVDRRPARVIIVVNEDWMFWSHRLALARAAARRLPAAAAPAARLVDAYLVEAYAGRPLDAGALAVLRGDLDAVEAAARRAPRARPARRT